MNSIYIWSDFDLREGPLCYVKAIGGSHPRSGLFHFITYSDRGSLPEQHTFYITQISIFLNKVAVISIGVDIATGGSIY